MGQCVPLSATEFVVSQSDTTGGHNPSFLVRWRAKRKVNPTIVQTIMIGAKGAQGISFVGRARVLVEGD